MQVISHTFDTVLVPSTSVSKQRRKGTWRKIQKGALKIESASTGEMGNIPVSLESGKWINQGNHGKGPQNEWDREIISGHTVVPLSGAQPQATRDPNTEQGQNRQKGGIFQRKLICGTFTHLMLWIKAGVGSRRC